MAWSFGESFDLYAGNIDLINGYWDSGSGTGAALVAGRFAGSQAIIMSSASTVAIKTSGVNDAVHHLVCAFRQTAAISGATLGAYFELFDGATAQCSVVFRSDGAILLASGGPAGTVLATYTGAFPVASTWYAFEFEVVINNTTGSFAVRKNGNTVNDFSATALNTRPTSANNYANKLQLGESAGVNTHQIDDLFWQSGSATGNWLGDLRCYARMPASNTQAQFLGSGSRTMQSSTNVSAATGGGSANTAYWSPAPGFIAPCSGYVTAMSFNVSVGITGHVIMALYAGGAAPGALLGTTNAATNPVAGVNTLTFPTPIHITPGSSYYAAFLSDVAVSNIRNSGAGSIQQYSLSNAYSSGFPSLPTGLTTSANNSSFHSLQAIIGTPDNYALVNEAQQDGIISYVFDSNPGDADFYGVASIASTPASIIATTVRAYALKSDAGTRTMAVQLKSGATTVASPTLVLTTSGFGWAWRTDLTDPATGAAWTAASVNAAQVGPKVIA